MAHLEIFDTHAEAAAAGKAQDVRIFAVVPMTGYGTRYVLDNAPLRADDSGPDDPHFLIPSGGVLYIQMARRWLRVSDGVPA